MTTVFVGSESALNLAIYNSNIGAGGTTIALTANIVLTHQLIVNKNSDVIDGGTNHFGIDANGSRGLVVQGGRVTLENLSITNATALGGAESHLDCRAAT